jgi:hypothetical protein
VEATSSVNVVSVTPPFTVVGGTVQVDVVEIVGVNTSNATIAVCNDDGVATSDPASVLIVTDRVGATSMAFNVTFVTASGVIPLCVMVNHTVSHQSSLLFVVNVSVDPVVSLFEPLQALADTATSFSIAGIGVPTAVSIFLSLYVSEAPLCSAMYLANPAYRLQPDLPSLSGGFIGPDRLNATSAAGIPVRGLYWMCFEGPSGTLYAVPGSVVLIVPYTSLLTSMTQDGLTNLGLGEDVFYTGYPIVFTVQGGGLDVADDFFFLTTNLAADDTAACRYGPGQIADATLAASVFDAYGDVLPASTTSRSFSISPNNVGVYRLCGYLSMPQSLPNISAAVNSTTTLRTVSSLIYDNVSRVVFLVGPTVTAATAGTEYQFVLAPDATCISVYDGVSPTIAIREVFLSTSADVPYVPSVSSLVFEALVFVDGAVLRSHRIEVNTYALHHVTNAIDLCNGSFPTSIAQVAPSIGDRLSAAWDLMTSISLLQNFDSLGCGNWTSSGFAATAPLFVFAEGMVSANPQLMRADEFIYGVLQSIGVGLAESVDHALQPQQALDIASSLLSSTDSNLVDAINRSYTFSMTHKEQVVDGLISLSVTAAYLLQSVEESTTPSNATQQASIALLLLGRAKRLAQLLCDGSSTSVALLPLRSNSAALGFAVNKQASGATLDIAVPPVSTTIVVSADDGNYSTERCFAAAPSLTNLLPNVSSPPRLSASSRRMQEQGVDASPTRSFNLPLLTAVALGVSQARVTFTYEFPVVDYQNVLNQRENDGEGAPIDVRVRTDVYRFDFAALVWIPEPTAEVSSDFYNRSVTLTIPSVSFSAGNGLAAFSGILTLDPVFAPLLARDYWLAVFVAAQVFLQLLLTASVLILWRNQQRRAKEQRDADLMAISSAVVATMPDSTGSTITTPQNNNAEVSMSVGSDGSPFEMPIDVEDDRFEEVALTE